MIRNYASLLYLPTSSSRDRDKITGETPFVPLVFSYRSTTRRLPSLRIFLLAREIFIFSFPDLRYSASDTKQFYFFEKIRDCGRIIRERNLLIRLAT